MRTAMLAALAATVHASTNMNGEYLIANPSPTGTYSTEYTDESFTVYSPPIRTQYSQVYWTMMDPVALPDDVVKRFDGKVMAVTGYEVDQVFTTPDGDKSVPIYWAYNHYYCAWLLSNKTTHMEEIPTDYTMGHPVSWKAAPIDPRAAEPQYPTSQFISEGNGGEFRKSYHGYPRSYAQLLESPTTFHITPMQIDTHNRDYNGSGFKAGPLPRSSAAPKDAVYSGLLECPCSTRRTKVYTKNYDMCADSASRALDGAEACYTAAAWMGGGGMKNASNTSMTLPAGCSLSVTDGTAFYNTNERVGVSCPRTTSVAGTMRSLVNMTASVAAGNVTLTISGPASVWFGVGFDAQQMSDLPYAIIVNGSGSVSERRLSNHAPGTVLTPQVHLVSSNVVGGVRTVVLSRAAVGASSTHFTFPETVAVVPTINAIGTTGTFEMHTAKEASHLALLNTEGATCVCAGISQGSIDGISFKKDCVAEPVGDLLKQHNPTCSIDTYAGGLHCCHHQWFLLDEDQPIPAPVDEYHLKFRFYYQEFEPTYHKNLERFYFQTEAWAGEYDIPQCKEGTPCEHVITAHFTPSMMSNVAHGNSTGMQLLYAGGHCHAPSCISMELYNADSGELLCRQVPVTGSNTTIFNELGYIAIPPCLWGEPKDGLEPPVFLRWNQNLTSIKINNNTNGHYGEMASWQTRGVLV